MNDLIKEISISEKILLGGDLSGDVEKDSRGYERVQGGQGF